MNMTRLTSFTNVKKNIFKVFDVFHCHGALSNEYYFYFKVIVRWPLAFTYTLKVRRDNSPKGSKIKFIKQLENRECEHVSRTGIYHQHGDHCELLIIPKLK